MEFSATTPFGVPVFPYLDALWTKLTGKSADAFVFPHESLPLATNQEVVISVVTYLAVIFGGQAMMKSFAPVQLSWLFRIHNLMLTVISLIMVMLFVEQILPIIANHGLLYSMCHLDAWTPKLALLFYLNYLIKYYELLDTVFLVLKKKKLDFLHYYHHSLTMVLCYVQLQGETVVSYIPVTLNLAVHVFMYYYYFRTSCGARVWWKKYMTVMQIIQFVIDIIVVYFSTYTYYTYTYFPHYPHWGNCRGTETAAIFGCVSLSSYLLLFIDFFRKTYTSKKPTATATGAVRKGGKLMANGAAVNKPKRI